jgi:hypothetical protein
VKTSNNQYLSIESYKEAIEILRDTGVLILYSFAKHSLNTKDTIIRGFIARTIVSLKGILKLYEIEDYADCWVLYRGILERWFHLKVLGDEDTFELFKKWSDKKMCNFKNRMRSDPKLKDSFYKGYFNDMDKLSEKVKEKIDWKRPKAEQVAKKQDLAFLYNYGYDYASMFVHPMADDGFEDFLRETNLAEEHFSKSKNPAEKQSFYDKRVVLHDSILVTVMLIQDGLNYSSFQYRAVLAKFLGNIITFLDTGSEKYKIDFVKFGKMAGQGIDLCLLKSR